MLGHGDRRDPRHLLHQVGHCRQDHAGTDQDRQEHVQPVTVRGQPRERTWRVRAVGPKAGGQRRGLLPHALLLDLAAEAPDPGQEHIGDEDQLRGQEEHPGDQRPVPLPPDQVDEHITPGGNQDRRGQQPPQSMHQ